MNEKRKEKTAKIITEKKKKQKQTQNKTKNYTNPICLI